MKPNESSGSQTIGSQSYRIITQYGDMLVTRQGIQHQHHHHHAATNRHSNHSSPHRTTASGAANEQQQQQQQQAQHQARPVIMTFHDIGLNSELQFARFCECDEVKLMLQTFTMIHVNFIGQEFLTSSPPPPQAAAATSSCSSQPPPNLPDDFKYPNVDQMAESIVDICTQLKVRSFIALAVGAGAYIVSSLALMRPDLIDGLFLINPVITSCSITEWLYFKMSAIAGNHHIAGSSSSSSSHADSQQNLSSSGSPKSGLRKLISAATHLHLSSASHHTTNHSNSNNNNAETEAAQDDTQSISQESISSQASKQHQTSGSRFRQLIFSRNLRNLSSTSSTNSGSFHQATSSPVPAEETASVGSRTVADLMAETNAKSDAQEAAKSSGGKRAPFEYLMYHHFGPATFQRYRRSSDTSATTNLTPSDSQADLESLNDVGASKQQQQRPQQQADSGSTSSRHSSPASAGGGSLGGRTDSVSRQLSSGGGGGGSRSARRRRSGSVCMNATYLASFSNDRQRQAYIQSAYKHYFYQINSHNLWLFAQSFVKRRTLNLRKDCGAAAHAAAAAATLGTSICTAFVGLAPAASVSEHAAASRAASAKSAAADSSDNPKQQQQQPETTIKAPHPDSGPNQSKQQSPNTSTKKTTTTLTQTAAASKQQQAQALVAGTKVKRTFTCQTLIMCSSVPMHCERAFKLMSLLNPLQATWIKTDHLLVLEERPDKVCQALRLFLQGIGYSMSTYERRLRLSSTTGSAGSADSSGSTRSYSQADAV